MVSIIAATGENGELGANNDLLWRLPNDMKRFKELTTGHTVIMGRKTYQSLPKGALPNRRNVVITKNPELKLDNCIIFNDLNEALSHFRDEDEIFIIGGASIYEQAMKFAEKLYITKVHETFENAETFFPEITENKWIKTESESHSKDDRHEHRYTFETFIKKK
jgi:dihydrofolate reductase